MLTCIVAKVCSLKYPDNINVKFVKLTDLIIYFVQYVCVFYLIVHVLSSTKLLSLTKCCSTAHIPGAQTFQICEAKLNIVGA